MKYYKIIALLLVFILVIPIIISCAADDDNTDNISLVTDDNDSSSENKTGENTDETGRENITDTLPNDLDFGGDVMRIMLRDDEPMYIDEIYAESESGEIVSDAVFRRNMYVEERLNMNFEYVQIPQSGFNQNIRNSVQSGSDDYDLIAGFAYYIPPLSIEGLLLNWRNIPYIDLNQPWWSNDCVEELTIHDKLYYITGDLSLVWVQSLYVYYFNKQMAQDFSLPDMYQLVLDGEWTWNKFSEISKSILNDLNGDGIFDENDQYGYAAWEFANVDGYFAAFDQPITAKNADGVPEFVVDTERTANIIDMIRDIMHGYGMYYNKADKSTVIPNMFMSGRNLFYYHALYESGTTFRNMEGDYGILPCPKYDETQAEYKTVAHDIYSLFCIPITCVKQELVGAATEAMAAESYRKVTPAYFETALKLKYSRDEETSQMLDIILNGATFNFGVVYSNAIDNVGYIMRDLLLFNDRDKNFTTYWEKRREKFETMLNDVIEKLSETVS